MAKAQRVLSIEIGYSLTQVCEMDFRSKHPQVYGVFSMKTPDGILNDGAISPCLLYTSIWDRWFLRIKTHLVHFRS